MCDGMQKHQCQYSAVSLSVVFRVDGHLAAPGESISGPSVGHCNWASMFSTGWGVSGQIMKHCFLLPTTNTDLV